METQNTTNDIMPNTWVPANSIIKVLGVGGGGCNAVNYMYNQRIEGCTLIVCNTDAQVLEQCNVPIKIQLGEDGLGAGTNPIEGRNAALNSQKIIEEKILNGNTEMLFITAGMGGGTGTGAAPVIASMAKKKGILTVGVVTIPFKSQGPETMTKAIDASANWKRTWIASLSSIMKSCLMSMENFCLRRCSLRQTKCWRLR